MCDDYLDIYIFDVYYETLYGRTEYVRFNAEDESHAGGLFIQRYPGKKIIEIVDRGATF